MKNRLVGSDQGTMHAFALESGIMVVGRFLGRGFSLLGQIAVARILGPASYGLYSLGYTLIRLGELIFPIGLDQAVVRFGFSVDRSRPQNHRAMILRSIWITIIVGIVFGGLAFVFAPLLAGTLFGKPELIRVIRWIAPGLALAAGLQVSASATTITRRMHFWVISRELVQPILNVILILLASFFGLRLYGALTALVLSYAAALASALMFLRKLFPEQKNTEQRRNQGLTARELFGFSIPAALARMFGSFILMFDRLIIGFFRTVREVGIYQAAAFLSLLFISILSAFNAALAPAISETYRKGDLSRLRQLYRNSTRWGIYISLPGYLVILVAPRLILSVVFGTEYSEGWVALVILATGQFIGILVGGVGPMLMMTGHQNRLMNLSAAAFLLHLSLSIVLVPDFGVLGGAIGVGAALAFLYFGSLWSVWRLVGCWPYEWQSLKWLGAALGAFIVLLLARGVLSCAPVLQFVALTAISYGAFLVLIILQGLPEDVTALLTRVFKRRHNPVEGWE